MKKRKYGQTATEYMLVLAGVVAVTLVGFKTYLPKVTETSEIYFNRTSAGIAGKPNPCGDGVCNVPFENKDNCCADCGGCIVAPPAIDGGWTGYGPCSESCGGGIMSRTCTLPAPANGGADCVGPASIACNTFPCPPVPVCTWNDWTACSATCGGGIMTRTCNSCLVADCPGGAAAAIATCNTQPCLSGCWSSWSTPCDIDCTNCPVPCIAGNCPVSCGAEGLVSRTCIDCSDAAATLIPCSTLTTVDTHRCYEGPCPVPGTWCAWEWGSIIGACSVQCNGGKQERTCACPPPLAGGDFCDPDVGITSTRIDPAGFEQKCNEQACVCTGGTPANSSPCAGQQDLSGENSDSAKTLVTNGDCDGSTLCQYSCNTGWNEFGGACIRYNCLTDIATDRSTYCYTLTQRYDNLATSSTPYRTVGTCPGVAAATASDTQLCYKDCIGLFIPNLTATNCVCPAGQQFVNDTPCDCCCPQNSVVGDTSHIYTCSGSCS